MAKGAILQFGAHHPARARSLSGREGVSSPRRGARGKSARRRDADRYRGDCKTLRGSFEGFHDQKAAHVLSHPALITLVRKKSPASIVARRRAAMSSAPRSVSPRLTEKKASSSLPRPSTTRHKKAIPSRRRSRSRSKLAPKIHDA